MRRLLFILALISFGCHPKNKPNEQTQQQPDSIPEINEDNPACTYKKTDRQASETFPFNQSNKIVLVSYGDRQDSFSNSELIKDERFIVPDIRQRVALDKNQIDSLFSIFYNFRQVRSGDNQSVADCYRPHHSIVFYQNEKAIAFYEICFECGGTRKTKDVNFGEFCAEKLCYLQRFFRANTVDFEIDDKNCR